MVNQWLHSVNIYLKKSSVKLDKICNDLQYNTILEEVLENVALSCSSNINVFQKNLREIDSWNTWKKLIILYGKKNVTISYTFCGRGLR